MNKTSSEQVKRMVADDLKKRHLTHQAVADKLGVIRQTITNILASKDYFNERNAALFELGLGYNREFLTSGNGQLHSDHNPENLERIITDYLSTIEMLKKANIIIREVCILTKRLGNEKCVELLKKAIGLSNCLSYMWFNYSGEVGLNFNMEKESFYRLYNELHDILVNEYSVVFIEDEEC